jgi:hypothetical protein
MVVMVMMKKGLMCLPWSCGVFVQIHTLCFGRLAPSGNAVIDPSSFPSPQWLTQVC